MSQYPDNLIAECIAYYKALDGRSLTPQEAERYLNSLADWYDWLEDAVRDGFRGSAP